MIRLPLRFYAAFLLKQALCIYLPYISAITELELFAYSDLSLDEEALIEEPLATISIIPVDSRIARLAAFVRRRHRLKVPDSVIAATAMFTGSKLLTRNTRDFRNIPNRTVLKV